MHMTHVYGLNWMRYRIFAFQVRCRTSAHSSWAYRYLCRRKNSKSGSLQRQRRSRVVLCTFPAYPQPYRPACFFARPYRPMSTTSRTITCRPSRTLSLCNEALRLEPRTSRYLATLPAMTGRSMSVHHLASARSIRRQKKGMLSTQIFLCRTTARLRVDQLTER
jgi:hypothetical protein